jgi:hypothetical protein
MNITIKDGRLFDGDRKLFIETKGNEAFTLFKLIQIINQIAYNESRRYERLLKRGGTLYFEEAVKEAIVLGKNSIDFTSEKNIKILNDFCIRWQLKFESFDSVKNNCKGEVK